jgi:electron transfer flavoprotein alpha subunit
MALEIYAYIAHKDGAADDTAMELALAADKIDPGANATAVVLGAGSDLDAVCAQAAGMYSKVIKVDNPALSHPNAELARGLLTRILPKGCIFLMAHDTYGMDLAPGLSIKMDAAFVSDVMDIQGLDGDALALVRQEYSGMVSTHVACDVSTGAVISVRPGSFASEQGKTAEGTVEDKSGEAGELSARRRFLEMVQAEVGDVDITKEDVLVSIGRGIEDEENIELAQELADAMGAVVSCSRPIVDAKWLEKSRQVGTSGQTVKPKVYLALGISGSFQHLGGLKGSPFVIAVNKNPKAPIFQTADVGVVGDILEYIPELTEKIEEL